MFPSWHNVRHITVSHGSMLHRTGVIFAELPDFKKIEVLLIPVQFATVV